MYNDIKCLKNSESLVCADENRRRIISLLSVVNVGPIISQGIGQWGEKGVYPLSCLGEGPDSV